MNILLTSAGRRTYLVRYFKEALGEGSKVYAANSALSPALCEADGYVLTPLIYADEYIPFLLEFCRKHEIGLLVPLFDIDVWMISKHRDEFLKAGVFPAVSDRSVLEICNDKLRMNEWLSEHSFSVPEYGSSVNEYRGGFPAYIKPRFGMGSIGLLKAEAKEELPPLYRICERRIDDSYLRYESEEKTGPSGEGRVLIEEEIRGQEFGLDVINDFSGAFVSVVIRKKLAMRSGETDEALVLTKEAPVYESLFELGRSVSECLHHIGNMDMDVIVSAEGPSYIIDMNARFGGGYPFSHAAGVDLPKAYAVWAKGEKADPSLFEVKKGIHAYKDIDIRIYEDGNV